MSKIIRGVIKGWLEPDGTCHYVSDSHCEWAARYFKIKLPPLSKDLEFMRAGVKLDDALFNKGWVKVHIKVDDNFLYFHTRNVPWKNLTHKQRKWLYEIAVYESYMSKEKLFPSINPRKSPLKIEFGNTGGQLDPEELKEEKLSFYKLLKKVLTERMSFKQLLDGSEEGRKERGRHDVKVKPMRVTTIDGNEAWTFKYKSSPSTTGQRWHGYISFFKDNIPEDSSAEDLDCKVSCDCPDYTYRYAYNNAKADAGDLGRNNGQKWKLRSQGGVGDYGLGCCKHLCALADYLKTKIEPDAPEPEEKPSTTIKTNKHPISKTTTTTKAPTPDDYSDDGRTGSLQEGVNKLYNNINIFVQSFPEFDIMCEDENTKDYRSEIFEDFHHLHKNYRLYEGNNHIIVVFEDNSRLMFELHYHNNHGPDKEKHRKKAFTKWKSLANEIHSDVQLSDVGNPIIKDWKTCFEEALKHPELQEYIRQPHHQRVFDNKDVAPCIDPVNFTPR